MSDDLKRACALAALDEVKDGMRLGIGTGSTAAHFVTGLAARIREGLTVVGVPTSEATRAQCEAEGVPLTTLEETPQLDLTVDGADEIDPDLALIKGGGGALLREKIVANASKRMVVIADGSKLVETLGAFPLPIEINHFGEAATINAIRQVASDHGLTDALDIRANADGRPFVTDGGHAIVDASFGRIVEPKALAAALNAIPGVVEHGLFIGLADLALVATPDGVKRVESR